MQVRCHGLGITDSRQPACTDASRFHSGSRLGAPITMLVRGGALGATMSDYLIQKIEATPNISVRLRTEAVDGQGTRRLEQLTLRDNRSSTTQAVPAAALFVMIGATPRTQWLRETITCDQRGFVLTGRDLAPATKPTGWPL